MTSIPVAPADDDAASASPLRCSAWAREEGIDPIGTAAPAAGFLLVAWPLPWPRDASEVTLLDPVHAALAGTGIRLQLVVPGDGVPTAVLHRTAPGTGGFRGYERVAGTAEPGTGVVEAALAVLRGEGEVRPGTDLLVCTHGKRDTCCGSLGTTLAQSAALADGATVLRTSHTGGHRFAPTALLLPDGTAWAFADEDLLRQVVTRAGDHRAVLARYRGCSGISAREGQALDRVAFAEVGWPWLDHARSATALDGGRVRLDAVAPDGTALAWEATVEVARMAPIPECGLPIDEATKSEPELRVLDVERVA